MMNRAAGEKILRDYLAVIQIQKSPTQFGRNLIGSEFDEKERKNRSLLLLFWVKQLFFLMPNLLLRKNLLFG